MPGTISNFYPLGYKNLRFLASASKNERVAAFQSDDSLVLQSSVHKKPVDIFLFHRVVALGFAYIDHLCISTSMLENARVNEAVIYHHIRLTYALHASNREQPGIARASAYKINLLHMSPSPISQSYLR